MRPHPHMLTLSFALIALGGTAMGDQSLVDFEGDFDFAAVEARDVAVSSLEADGSTWLRMDSGHAEPWPGITLPAPGGRWDLSAFAYVLLDVRNVGARRASPTIRIDNPGADGQKHCVQIGIDLGPGESGTIRADLPTVLVDPATGEPIEFFGMRGWPGNMGKREFDPKNVTQVLVFLPQPQEDHSIAIDNLRAVGAPQVTEVPSPFFPMIDEFGQFIHRDWPGKVHSEAELADRRTAEARELDEHPGPEGWNKWGGWAAGPQLEATGWFRVEKVDGQWWLVDPDGRLFWSHGIDCVHYGGEYTPLDDRENWYQWLPERDSPLGAFYGTGRGLHGYYAGREVRTFSFTAANLVRKYGDGWKEAFSDVCHRRLRSWGMNTIGNWSDWGLFQQDRTPYVVSVGFGGKMLEGSEGYWGKFRDVFDESFAEAVREGMKGAAAVSADDPWCIGYFIDNEIAWNDDTSLAIGALRSPADQAAKQEFVRDLQAKYASVDDLNETWGTDHASWEALLESREPPNPRRAREDLTAFYTKSAERYFSTIRAAVDELAPNHLYLGCRFAWANPLAVEQAARFCHVVSYNLYQRSVADFALPEGLDVPLIIGEFHFGALDRGMFHTGLVPVESQEVRAESYRSYVQGCLRNPSFVGCHWFQYIDEPTTGRWLDEENYQIGFVDTADTPYPETVQACREVGYSLYEYRREARPAVR